ncbi:hypothetical protein [Lamprobacter modestohalophilus]|uniref:hypothetical protein n=1 Tax=Lamprobacter modestohalophilus TaxID=1064514 RepID=UPI001F5BF0C8|nr:hypothetical protein [Lamprobacter modestohalophilus]
MNIDRIANAIEADAGEEIPGLREGLAEMQAEQSGVARQPSNSWSALHASSLAYRNRRLPS